MHPDPIIELHEVIFVVREDVFKGGTKRRFVDVYVELMAKRGAKEFVYATTVYGGAQIALAHACRAVGVKATVFGAQRKTLHARTQEAKDAGAEIHEVPMGFLTNVQAKARTYCEATGAHLMPFGFDSPAARAAICAAAIKVRVSSGRFDVAVCAVGSGVLIRSLQEAQLARSYVGVLVGRDHANAGDAQLIRHKLQFGADAKKKDLPPFPSCANYDAKAWATARELRGKFSRVVFWNVMG
jgi:hypothetical protein